MVFVPFAHALGGTALAQRCALGVLTTDGLPTESSERLPYSTGVGRPFQYLAEVTGEIQSSATRFRSTQARAGPCRSAATSFRRSMTNEESSKQRFICEA